MAQLHFKDGKAKNNSVFKIKKLFNEKIFEHKCSEDSSSDTEETDFSQTIHPIGYFINDREKMIEEMFSIIKGEKLRNMLPPLLKDYSLEELKADCLVHLLGMSKKRIFAILEGHELNSSSDTESESIKSSEESDKTEEVQIPSNIIIKSEIEEDDTLDISVSKNDLDALIEDKSNIQKHSLKKKRPKIKVKKESKQVTSSIIALSDDDDTDQKKHKKLSKKSHKSKEKRHKKLKKKKTINNDTIDLSEDNDEEEQNKTQESESDKGKSLLEILELEMRARAIRALLKNTVNAEEPVPVSLLNMDLESDHKADNIVNVGQTITEITDNNIKEKNQISKSAKKNKTSDVCLIDLTSEISNSNCLSDSALLHDSVIINKKNENDNLERDANSKRNSNDKEKNEDINWSDRWVESKNVKKVMKSNQICANIRKRMRFARMLKQKQMENQKRNNDVVDFSNVEESSVAQYNLIKSLDKKKNNIT